MDPILEEGKIHDEKVAIDKIVSVPITMFSFFHVLQIILLHLSSCCVK